MGRQLVEAGLVSEEEDVGMEEDEEGGLEVAVVAAVAAVAAVKGEIGQWLEGWRARSKESGTLRLHFHAHVLRRFQRTCLLKKAG